MRRHTSSTTRVLRLAALIACLCAWFALPTASPARADENCTDDDSTLLCLGYMKKNSLPLAKGDTKTYTVSVAGGKQVIIGAINVDAIAAPNNAAKAPKIRVTCPSGEATNDGEAEDGQVVFCRPGGSGSKTVTIKLTGDDSKGVSYGVFAELLDNATSDTIDLDRKGESLSSRHIRLFSTPNSNTGKDKRTLTFKPTPTAFAAAMLYRSDASRICGTLYGKKSCDTYDGDYSDYYLVVMNAGAPTFTYDVKLSS